MYYKVSKGGRLLDDINHGTSLSSHKVGAAMISNANISATSVLYAQGNVLLQNVFHTTYRSWIRTSQLPLLVTCQRKKFQRCRTAQTKSLSETFSPPLQDIRISVQSAHAQQLRIFKTCEFAKKISVVQKFQNDAISHTPDNYGKKNFQH